MPRPLASILSLLFVLGVAVVLSLPVITSSDELVLQPKPFDGLVGEVSHSAQRFATLDRGRADDVGWSLQVSELPTPLCLSLDTDSVPGDDLGLMCSESPTEEVGTSQFIPASASWRTSALIAVLPGDVEVLRLRATDEVPIHGSLYALPSDFRSDASVLLVFLPAGADIVAASATTTTGDPLDVSRLADQVDAY